MNQAAMDPTRHVPDETELRCRFCGDLSENPTRCPGWLKDRMRFRFHAEAWDEDAWTMVVSPKDTREEVEEQLAFKRQRWPELPMRIVSVVVHHAVVANFPAPVESRP